MQSHSLESLHWACPVTPERNHPCSLVLRSTPTTFGAFAAAPRPPTPRATVSARARRASSRTRRQGGVARLWRGDPRSRDSSARQTGRRARGCSAHPRGRPGRPAGPERAHLRLSSPEAVAADGVPRAPSERAAPAGGAAGGAPFPAPRPRLSRGLAGRRAQTLTPSQEPGGQQARRLRPRRLRRGGRGCGRAAQGFSECRVWPSNTAKKK